jgi:LuxR family maltose regulon positive regulatory protein
MLHKALTLAEPEGYIRTFVDEGEAMRLMILDFRFWIAEQTHVANRGQLSVYSDQLLVAFPAAQQSGSQPGIVAPPSIQPPTSNLQNLVEPLSARELEILDLMAAGLSNQEIADRLIITLGTVKSHANHIFAKLGVQGRVKAINRARELALI